MIHAPSEDLVRQHTSAALSFLQRHFFFQLGKVQSDSNTRPVVHWAKILHRYWYSHLARRKSNKGSISHGESSNSNCFNGFCMASSARGFGCTIVSCSLGKVPFTQADKTHASTLGFPISASGSSDSSFSPGTGGLDMAVEEGTHSEVAPSLPPRSKDCYYGWQSVMLGNMAMCSPDLKIIVSLP